MKNIFKVFASLIFIAQANCAFAQIDTTLTKLQYDSLYIKEVEEREGKKLKILHAEPLYIDLIRDLGARKGESEWNFGGGITDNLGYDSYEALVEYEWAPIDRLGLEVELPFTFYAKAPNSQADSLPSDAMESLKLAAQWSFFVSEKWRSTFALGYINEFLLSDFGSFGNPWVRGNMFNPFLVAAKRWGTNFHTLIYTGPQFERLFEEREWHFQYEFHTNIHYMIPGTRNFIGVEFNKYFSNNDFDMTIRPQMRVGVSDNLLIGIVGGIPIERENQRFSSFIRIIWEPEYKHR